MSLKTWVSGVPSQVPSQVPRASKIPGLLAQWARWNSNIFRALLDLKINSVLPKKILEAGYKSRPLHVVAFDHTFSLR